MAKLREKKTFHSPCVAAQRQLTNRPANARSSLTAVTYVVHLHAWSSRSTCESYAMRGLTLAKTRTAAKLVSYFLLSSRIRIRVPVKRPSQSKLYSSSRLPLARFINVILCWPVNVLMASRPQPRCHMQGERPSQMHVYDYSSSITTITFIKLLVRIDFTNSPKCRNLAGF